MSGPAPAGGVPSDSTSRPLQSAALERYCSELLVALRLRDVPGEHIGSVLVEVRDHLLCSDEDPVDVFGVPEEFAAAVAGEVHERARPAVDVLRNAAGVAGLLWCVEGAAALLSGRPATLTVADLVLPAVAALAAPRLVDVVARARPRALLGWGALVCAVVTVVVLLEAWVGSWGSVTVAPVAVLVPGAVVAGSWIAVTARRIDPVVGPFDGAASLRRRRRRDGVGFVAAVLALLVVPVAVLVVSSSLG